MVAKKKPNKRGEWQCSKCGEWLPPEAFYSDKSTANGLYPYCKKCKAAIDAVGGAVYHAAHRDELNAKKRRYRAEQKASHPESGNQK